MHYAQMRQYDIANGPGIRSTIFVTGCSRHCFNCFNPEYQDPKAGQEWTDKEMEQLLSWLSAPTNGGLTLLGGEPMENTAGLTQIVQKVKQALPDKSVWVYSGFTYDEIMADPQKKALLDVCDVLVDGPFVDDLKDPGLYFRGSSNQRVIDLKATRKKGQVTLVWPDGR